MATATRVFGAGDAGAAVTLLCLLCSPGTPEGPAAPEGPQLRFPLANAGPRAPEEQGAQERVLFGNQGLPRWPRAGGCRTSGSCPERGARVTRKVTLRFPRGITLRAVLIA